MADAANSNAGQLSEAEVKARADQAWKLRDLWKSILRDAYELAMPWRSNPYSGNKNAPPTMSNLYTDTAPNAAFKLANKLLQEFTPPGDDWINLTVGPLLEIDLKDDKNAIEEVNKWLAKIVRVISMPLSSAAFTSAIWECYLDMVVSGLGAMLVQGDESNDMEPMLYENVPQNEIAIAEGPNRRVEEIYRNREIKARMVKRKWSDAVIPEELQKLLDDRKKDHDITVLEATYYVPGSDRPWFYEVFWTKKGNDPVRLVQRRLHDNPWVIFRWTVLPGIPYGPGPVLMALANIRTENKIMEMILINAALALAGMYLAKDDGVINTDTLQITQGGIIPVASTGGTTGASLVPLETGRSFNVGQIVLDDLRTQIKKTMLDLSLPDPGEGSFSPTEILKRTQEMTQDYGGSLGRLTNDVIVPVVRLTANTMSRSGKVPPVKVDQMLVKVDVNSPMAQARQLSKLQRTVQWLETSNAVAGRDVTMLSAKLEDFPSWSGRLIGVPTDLIRDGVEREQLQKQVAEIIAMQQMQASGSSMQQAV